MKFLLIGIAIGVAAAVLGHLGLSLTTLPTKVGLNEGSAASTSGSLDPSFGQGGTVVTSFSGVQSFASDVARDSKNRIVVAGMYKSTNSTVNRRNGGFAVARYMADGSLDSSFGKGGQLTVNTGAYQGWARLAIDSGDRLILATSVLKSGSYQVLVTRYNADGSLDASFGSSGKTIFSFEKGVDTDPMKILTDSRGGILVVGYSGPKSALTRLNPNGSIDAAFGNKGKVFTAIGSQNSIPHDMALDLNGRIVVIGISADWGSYDFFTAVYSPDGKLDNSFGKGGLVIQSFSDWDMASGVAIDSGNRIVVGGISSQNGTGDSKAVLVRYNSNGSLDTSFGSGGIVIRSKLYQGTPLIGDVAVDSQGRIVTAGSAVARYLSSGSLDTGFGLNGVSPAPYYNVSYDSTALMIDSADRIVDIQSGSLAGDWGIYDFIIQRILP